MDIEQSWNAYTIKDGIYNADDAWQRITENILKSPWNKLRLSELQPESTEPKGIDSTSEVLDICQSLPAFNNLNEDNIKNW